MPDPADIIPVVLLAHARPDHLRRVLACLKENAAPLVYAFVDGSRGDADAAAVKEVAELMAGIDWCEVRLTKRTRNLGLGENVRASVGEVARRHEAFVVWEDDLVCVPGTYAWMCAALRRYADDERVMSVSAWTHPRVTPCDIGDSPYLDARAECWVWGAWARSWRGMEESTALEKMRLAARRGVAPDDYGADLPVQARSEARRNVWAVRWLYHHFQHGGLCVRPPWSMVEHIGFDATATNAGGAGEWANPPLRDAPSMPVRWPEVREHPACRDLWRAANPGVPFATRVRRKLKRVLGGVARRAIPPLVLERLRPIFGWRWFRGRYATWVEARAAARGYDDAAIVQKVLHATLEVKAGRAAFERDSVLFAEPEPDAPLLAALREVPRATPGKLRVLDFGGSLGSTYWRHRKFFPEVESLIWDVVEQPAFVDAGRRRKSGINGVLADSVQTSGLQRVAKQDLP